MRSATTDDAVGPAPAPAPWNRDAPGRIAIYEHCIHDAANLRQHAVFGHEGRMHPGFDAAIRPARYAQMLDGVAQFRRVTDVFRGDAGNTFGENAVHAEAHIEGQRRENRELVGRIDAFHIEGRIGFRVAERLCRRQGIPECGALLGHGRQYVVRRAIDDAGNGTHPAGREPPGERADDRNAAGHRCLEAEPHSLLGGAGKQFVAVPGDDRLVRRDHGLPARQGVPHQARGAVLAADEFHHHVDIVVEQGFEIRGEFRARQVRFRPGGAAGNPDELQRTPRLALQVAGARRETGRERPGRRCRARQCRYATVATNGSGYSPRAAASSSAGR